ncbi:MAG: hypothetical protein KGI38_11095 [Thaumarchaeota archaeon]|nr:hypothetical protein [Nitrososphaerota archaeon]
MTNITFSLPAKTIRRLRRRAADTGRKKGVISELVDEAIASYLDALESSAEGQTFTALKGERPVAEGKSLQELASALRARGVDPRSVRIVSSEPLEPVGHMGLRVHAS